MHNQMCATVDLCTILVYLTDLILEKVYFLTRIGSGMRRLCEWACFFRVVQGVSGADDGGSDCTGEFEISAALLFTGVEGDGTTVG